MLRLRGRSFAAVAQVDQRAGHHIHPLPSMSFYGDLTDA